MQRDGGIRSGRYGKRKDGWNALRKCCRELNIRYSSHETILTAKTLDDLWDKL